MLDMLKAGFLFGLLVALKECADSAVKRVRETEEDGTSEQRRAGGRKS